MGSQGAHTVRTTFVDAIETGCTANTKKKVCCIIFGVAQNTCNILFVVILFDHRSDRETLLIVSWSAPRRVLVAISIPIIHPTPTPLHSTSPLTQTPSTTGRPWCLDGGDLYLSRHCQTSIGRRLCAHTFVIPAAPNRDTADNNKREGRAVKNQRRHVTCAYLVAQTQVIILLISQHAQHLSIFLSTSTTSTTKTTRDSWGTLRGPEALLLSLPIHSPSSHVKKTQL